MPRWNLQGWMIAGLLLLSAGCATAPEPPPGPPPAFDLAEHLAVMRSDYGPISIRGQGLLLDEPPSGLLGGLFGGRQVQREERRRQRRGPYRTCAGQEVLLAPATAYADAWFRGRIPDPDPRFLALVRRTRCDAEGIYQFRDLPYRAWLLRTEICGPGSDRINMFTEAQRGVLIGRMEPYEVGGMPRSSFDFGMDEQELVPGLACGLPAAP